MEWEYLESLVKQSEINDLNEDNSKKFISDFYKFIKEYRVFEHSQHASWDKRKSVGRLLTFEKIEESQEHILIVFRDYPNIETNFYLSYDSYPKFAFLKDDILKTTGVYISYCVSKSRWVRDIDPNKRLEEVFIGFRGNFPKEP